MYQNAALLALLAFGFAMVSARIDRSRVSGPILFVAAGLLLGPAGLGLLAFAAGADALRVLAELALAMVLFGDAGKADLARIRRSIGVPERLLLLGLPLTIVLGFLAGLPLLPGLAPVEVALLAAILAPTDAALGKPVVESAAVPADLREPLNFESGLNDGICVPIVLALLDIAVGRELHGTTAQHLAGLVVEEIGIGVAVGLGLTGGAVWIVRHASARDWIAEGWRAVAVVALAAACFLAAQLLGGSGFIACFVGGLVFNRRAPERHQLLLGAEATGDVLALLTWVAFGAAVVWQVADRISGSIVLYAALSLTVVRMLPVYLCLAGSAVDPRDRLFVGWFGPRGLASIVFGIIVLDAGVPGGEVVEATIVCTVLMSVVAHGATSNALIRLCARRWAARA